MIALRAIVLSEVGLHARPASVLVQLVNQFKSSVSIRKIDNVGIIVDAKSILNILILGINKGDEIELIIEGDDEDRAADVLKPLINSGFAGI